MRGGGGSGIGALKTGSDWLTEPHFIFQLVLSVDLVVSDVEVVGGVVVDGLWKAEKDIQEGLAKAPRGGGRVSLRFAAAEPTDR